MENKKTATEKKIEKLRKLAIRSAELNYKLITELEKAKQLPDWKETCDKLGICHDSDADDWKC